MMVKPQVISVDKQNTTADTVSQVVYPVEQRRKRELLSELIGKKNWQQVLVFTATREAADTLVKELNLDGIPSEVVHGEKGQGSRRRALREFVAGDVRVLVATEVAARGLDIQALNTWLTMIYLSSQRIMFTVSVVLAVQVKQGLPSHLLAAKKNVP